MTAEVLLFLFLFAATALSAGLGALILAAFGQTGWFVIVALAVTAALVWRVTATRLAATSGWSNEDLRDDWRAS